MAVAVCYIMHLFMIHDLCTLWLCDCLCVCQGQHFVADVTVDTGVDQHCFVCDTAHSIVFWQQLGEHLI